MSATAAPATAGLSVRNLGVRLGANDVLQGLDLDVQEGEFLVLLGPSGCGKSTLLHGIAGLIDVNTGSVHIAGHDMTQAEPSDRGIGMVFQSYALYPTMTVERNMSFGLSLSGAAPAEVKRRVAEVAQMLQLQTLLQRKPAQLSGGQRQRVAIGRALVRQARVFLLDEPLSNLDAKLRTELRRELKLLHQSLGATMIYVTHDQVEAMTLATRIVVMRGGKIQQVGAPAEVYAQPQSLFVAGFLGSPGMNFVEGILMPAAGPGLDCRFESPNLSLDLPCAVLARPVLSSQAVVLGLRPEHIRIDAHGTYGARVHLIEPMGNHLVVWLACEREAGVAPLTLAVVVRESLSAQVGDSLRFHIDLASASVFDQQSERRL